MFDKDSVCEFDMKEYQIEERGGAYLLISSKYRNWLKTSKTGVDILERLNGTYSLQDVAGQIACLYDMPKKKILEDVIAFCNDLEQKGFFAYDEQKQINSYTNFYIDIHNACPFTCIYCNKKCRFDNKTLGVNALRERLKKYDEKIDRAISIINLTGGEPLMNPDIEKILSYLGTEGYKFSIHTSGYKFTQKIAEIVKKYEGIVYLSIDSPQEKINNKIRGINAYNIAVNAAKIMESLQIPFYITCTPVKGYFQELIDLMEFSYELGAVGLKINQPIKMNANGEKIDLHFEYTLNDFFELENDLFKQFSIINSWRNNNVKKQRKFVFIPARFNCVNSVYLIRNKIDCGATYTDIMIDINGNRYPCYMLQIPQFSNFQKSEIEKTWQYKTCQSCQYWIFCLGGCHALDCFFENGHEQYCKYAKHFYESLFWGE